MVSTVNTWHFIVSWFHTNYTGTCTQRCIGCIVGWRDRRTHMKNDDGRSELFNQYLYYESAIFEAFKVGVAVGTPVGATVAVVFGVSCLHVLTKFL